MSKVFTAIGNACTDLVAHVDEDFLVRHSLAKGFCKFILNPSELKDMKSQMGNYKAIGGGAAANVAHVVAALGGQSHLISKIANDDIGLKYKSDLEKNGVSCNFPPPASVEQGSPQVPTLITPDGERTFVSFDGVARSFEFSDFEIPLLEKTDYLYLDGYCYLSPYTGESFYRAAKIVRGHGGHVTFNIGDKSFYQSHKADIDNLLSVADSIMCSEAEAEMIFGYFKNQHDLMNHLSNKFFFGGLTIGAEGALVFYDKKIVTIPPISIPKITDTNGAGDHFSGGFIYGLMSGLSLEQSGRLGALCSADCLSHSGARPLGGFESLKPLVQSVKT
jgi:sugar/nucleoside kinase (ribokinase family)